MLGDRRRVNRLLKSDRRRSHDRRTGNRYNGRRGPSAEPGGQVSREERRMRDRRFADRIKSN